MNRTATSLALLCAVATCGVCTAAADRQPVRMKSILISGWDLLHVNTADVWRNRAKFAATGADGALLPIDGRRSDGSSICGYWPMNGKDWKEEYFADARRQLAEITASPGLRESFVLSLWTPKKRLAWTDDEAWRTFVENLAIIARTARAGGLQGIFIDSEDYSKTKQFFWIPGDPCQKELLPLVRRRGREVFGRMYNEFPDAAVMAYGLFSVWRVQLPTADPLNALLAKGDLWTTFLNGLLDVAPRGARIIDGCGSYGYSRDIVSKNDYKKAADEARYGLSQFVYSSNKAKYAETLSVGFSQWIDEYVMDRNKDDPCFMPLNGSAVARFKDHLVPQFKEADEYVLMYGERCTWIDWDDKKGDKVLMSPTWESKLPGLAEMFRSVKGERAHVRLFDKDLVNVIGNSDCDLPSGKKLPFPTWRSSAKDPYPFAYEPKMGASKPGCLKLTGDGLFAVDARGFKTGDRIVVKAKAMGQSASLHCIWSSKGERLWGMEVDVGPVSRMSESEWTELSAVLEVPESKKVGKPINGINIQIVGTYASPEHPLYYDDIQVLVRKGHDDE